MAGSIWFCAWSRSAGWWSSPRAIMAKSSFLAGAPLPTRTSRNPGSRSVVDVSVRGETVRRDGGNVEARIRHGLDHRGWVALATLGRRPDDLLGRGPRERSRDHRPPHAPDRIQRAGDRTSGYCARREKGPGDTGALIAGVKKSTPRR